MEQSRLPSKPSEELTGAGGGRNQTNMVDHLGITAEDHHGATSSGTDRPDWIAGFVHPPDARQCQRQPCSADQVDYVGHLKQYHSTKCIRNRRQARSRSVRSKDSRQSIGTQAGQQQMDCQVNSVSGRER